MRLSDIPTGQTAIVLKVLGYGGFRRRVMEMGFVRGKRVEVLLNAPLRDPIKYKIMDYEVSLRRSEAEMVEVITEAEAKDLIGKLEDRNVLTEEELFEEVVSTHRRVLNVALVGNPNSGKTSLFNALSGGHEHVGNYSGVTVDAKSGTFRYKGYRFNITDLPGTYALSAYSPEEIYVRRHLVENTPDIVINAVVASNLERNLYLTTELIDINPNMVVALNMYDELEARGDKLDYEQLGGMLGVPMVPVVAREGRGLDRLLDTVINVYENRDSRVRHIHINHGAVVESGIAALQNVMRPVRDQLPKHFPPRYWAIKLLERDKEAEHMLQPIEGFAEWIEVRDREVERIEKQLGEDVEMAVTSEKYGFIAGALRETYQKGEENPIATTTIIDTIVTHRVWGFPIFFFLMWLMFAATFSLGAYPQEWIEMGVEWLSNTIGAMMPDGALKDLIINGVIGGVGSVIVFLPNILILYLFISLMEDSGYMARAAFIMDKLMHRIGLHGKSFIPLLMSFGCNVPAIMACRTIESRSSRVITILISPFMSCSARLPIYILLIGTFFPSYASLVLIALYILGIIVAIITAKLMRRFLFPVEETPFVMELPPYRVPTLQATLRHMWEKGAQYLRKMGGVILVGSLIVWFLSYYPRPNVAESDIVTTTEHIADDYSNSYLGQLGKVCEPIMRPIGLNWKGSVALLSGATAKEIVVSTLGVLYATEPIPTNEEGELSEDASLGAKLVASGDFDTRTALAFMVFILLYFPCIATLIASAKETGRWYWAAATVFYNTAIAWVAAFIIYLIGGLF